MPAVAVDVVVHPRRDDVHDLEIRVGAAVDLSLRLHAQLVALLVIRERPGLRDDRDGASRAGDLLRRRIHRIGMQKCRGGDGKDGDRGE